LVMLVRILLRAVRNLLPPSLVAATAADTAAVACWLASSL
jgi:hypothetical protein